MGFLIWPLLLFKLINWRVKSRTDKRESGIFPSPSATKRVTAFPKVINYPISLYVVVFFIRTLDSSLSFALYSLTGALLQEEKCLKGGSSGVKTAFLQHRRAVSLKTSRRDPFCIWHGASLSCFVSRAECQPPSFRLPAGAGRHLLGFSMIFRVFSFFQKACVWKEMCHTLVLLSWNSGYPWNQDRHTHVLTFTPTIIHVNSNLPPKNDIPAFTSMLLLVITSSWGSTKYYFSVCASVNTETGFLVLCHPQGSKCQQSHTKNSLTHFK